MPDDSSNRTCRESTEKGEMRLNDCLSEIQTSLNSIVVLSVAKLSLYEYLFWTRPDDYRFYGQERDLLELPLLKTVRRSAYAGLGTFVLLRAGRGTLVYNIYRTYFTKQKAAPQPIIAGIEPQGKKLESYLERKSREQVDSAISRVFEIKNPFLAKLASKISLSQKHISLAFDAAFSVIVTCSVGAYQFYQIDSKDIWHPVSQAPLQPGLSVVHEVGCPQLNETAQQLHQKYGVDLASDKLRVYADLDGKQVEPKDPENLLRTAHTLYINCQLRSKYYERMALLGSPVPYPGIKRRGWE